MKKKRVSYKGMSKAQRTAIVKQNKATRLAKKIARQKRNQIKKLNSLKKKAAKTKAKNYFREETGLQRQMSNYRH